MCIISLFVQLASAPWASCSRWGEEALIKNGLAVTVLRNNFFMNHLLKTDCENIDKEGWFSNPLGDTRNSFVCTNDIAEARREIETLRANFIARRDIDRRRKCLCRSVHS